MKLELLLADFQKILKYQMPWQSVQSGIRVDPCGQTDRQTWRS